MESERTKERHHDLDMVKEVEVLYVELFIVRMQSCTEIFDDVKQF